VGSPEILGARGAAYGFGGPACEKDTASSVPLGTRRVPNATPSPADTCEECLVPVEPGTGS
jgi:hypothetical protein